MRCVRVDRRSETGAGETLEDDLTVLSVWAVSVRTTVLPLAVTGWPGLAPDSLRGCDISIDLFISPALTMASTGRSTWSPPTVAGLLPAPAREFASADSIFFKEMTDALALSMQTSAGCITGGSDWEVCGDAGVAARGPASISTSAGSDAVCSPRTGA